MISAALMADVHRQFGSKTFQAPDTQHTQKALVYFGISQPNIRGARHNLKSLTYGSIIKASGLMNGPCTECLSRWLCSAVLTEY